MCSLPFHIVDVFAETQYAGNQLAVVRDAGALAEAVMLKIAKEMNYSETTFILSTTERDGGYDVRIFTPEKEIPFAGHPTLGTAYIIQQYVLRRPTECVRLNLKPGQIPVTFSYVGPQPDTLWMQQFAPTFQQYIAAERVAPVLGLDVDELDERFPVEEVSTGLPTLIVPLKTLVSLKRIELAKERYFSLIADTWAKAILVFCPETYHPQNALNVRFFAPYYKVPEDPATGSANGCLAAYLVRHGYFDTTQIDLRVEQGYEIGRPSLLFLKAREHEGSIEIEVGGKVIPVAEGRLL